MNRKFTSRHGAVMTEPIIVIGFFAIISVFLLRMFASTEKVRSDADEISKAVIRAESAAEWAMASDNDEEIMDFGFQELTVNGVKHLVMYYDKNWRETPRPEKYMMTLNVTEEERPEGTMIFYNFRVSEVNIFDNSGELYSLTAKKYLRGGKEG